MLDIHFERRGRRDDDQTSLEYKSCRKEAKRKTKEAVLEDTVKLAMRQMVNEQCLYY